MWTDTHTHTHTNTDRQMVERRVNQADRHEEAKGSFFAILRKSLKKGAESYTNERQSFG